MSTGAKLAQPNKLARKSRVFPSLVIEQIKRMESDYGGREGLIAMLTLSPLTPDVEYFLGQLGDPRNASQSLGEICARSNVLPGHILHLLTEASYLTAKARAAHIAQRGISPVVEDIVRRAAPYEEDCLECMVDGKPTGSVTPEPSAKVPNPGPIPCPTCKGALRLLHMPELSRQELALDLANLLPKGGGGINIAVQQNNHQHGGSVGGTLDTIQQLAEQALYGGDPLAPPIVEGDVLSKEDA